MPNRDYRIQRLLEHCGPSKWMNSDGPEEMECKKKFEDLMDNENFKISTLKDFSPSKWSTMDESQKINLCQKLENSLAFENGRAPYKILSSDDSVKVGATDSETKTIDIWLKGACPYDALHTLVHESCHADQYELIDKREKACDNPNTINDFEQALDKSGLSHNDILVMNWETYHYVGQENHMLYQMQIMEIDAECEAVKFLRKYNTHMEHEEGFTEYVENKEQEFEKLRDSFKNEELVKSWLDDRSKRVVNTKRRDFTEPDIEQLKTIFSSQHINDCGFKALSNLKNWVKPFKTAKVQKVTLDTLLEKNQEKKEQRQKHSPKMPLKKEGRVTLDELLEESQEKKEQRQKHSLEIPQKKEKRARTLRWKRLSCD